MDLSSFMKTTGRALPVFLLIDTSGSMQGQYGEKIGSVNVAVKEMLASLKSIEHPKGIIKLCIITFGGNVTIEKELSEISDSDAFTFKANGGTPMGEAISKTIEMIEDESIVTQRDYKPTIVLISDGMPTDYGDYRNASTEEEIIKWEPLHRLNTLPRSSKAMRLAMSIGDDADKKLLRAFINDSEIPLITAKENSTISKFFKWVTMSITTKSVSCNPDDIKIESVSPFGDDELFF